MTRATDGIRSIAVSDLDGDGDVDIVSASELDDKVAWYENLTTGVGVDPGTRPAEFHVTPAYPNPASQSTSFMISGLRPGIVSVEVYDVLGRRWASQQVSYHGAESERVVVDVAELPPGVYACRVRLGRSSSTRAIVVL